MAVFMSFTAPSKLIKVRYFALLREERGLEFEELETTASTLNELYQELTNRYRFSFETTGLAVSQDDTFAAWSDSLIDGATVVFIPPVAGG